MQLHSECRQVVEMIEETGAVVREIRDLEEQVSFTLNILKLNSKTNLFCTYVLYLKYNNVFFSKEK